LVTANEVREVSESEMLEQGLTRIDGLAGEVDVLVGQIRGGVTYG